LLKKIDQTLIENLHSKPNLFFMQLIKYLKGKLHNYIDARIDYYFFKNFHLRVKKELLLHEWERAEHQGDNRILKYIDKSVKLYCFLDSYLAKNIYCENFENDELVFVSKFLRPGDYFIDIGANIGLFSLIASKVVGNEGMVFSFEPTPKTFKRFTDNIELNGCTNIRPFCKAISSHEEQLEFFVLDEKFEAWNSLAKPSIGESKSIVVDSIPLDLIPNYGVDWEKVKLIK
jgi:FkbM family methyltransferase